MNATISISAIGLTAPLLSAAKQLGRKHSNTLGFFPEGAFDDHAGRGHLLAASLNETDFVGYCAFRVSRGRAMIAHLCVAESHRGTGAAKKLFEGVKAYAQKHDLRGIGLHCRRDYPAYSLWPKLDFAPISSKPGRGSDGAELTFWWHDLHTKDLLSIIEDSDDRLRVAIDCNIFRDLHDTSEPRNQEAKFLLADWLSGQIELCSVKELFFELDRLVLASPRDALKKDAMRYRILDHGIRRTALIYEELKTIFGHHNPSPQQKSDMTHVAMSAGAEADVLLTRDEEMLGHAAEIRKRYGLQVMRPVELISRLNETEQAALYQPVRFASTDIQKTRPRPEDVDRLAEMLHAPAQRETRTQFAAKLRTILCDTQHSTVIAAAVDSVPLFLIAHNRAPGCCKISIVRCARNTLAATSLRHAILQIITEMAKVGISRILVSEPLLAKEVLIILHELGFQISPAGLEKLTLRVLGVRSALNKALESIEQPPIAAEINGTEIEARYWPAKILDANVETWAVAIQAGWATELFETKFADELLIRPNRDLILSRENVYYSAATQSGMEGAQGRLLWYVSKDRRQAGSQTIRACSRLLEVRRGPAKVLFNEFRHLGVFEWRDIFDLADGNKDKEIIAMRFADTELFDDPFPGVRAKELGINNNFTSPVKVPESAFVEIYRQGMRLAISS